MEQKPNPALQTTKAAVLQERMRIVVEERKLRCPGPDEVLMKVMAVGVCGSDVHYYEHGHIGRKRVEKPLIQGHECAGLVVQTGENVKSVKPGDRVAVEPGIPCLQCGYCKSGRYNLCPSVSFLSSPPVDGALSEYIIHPAHLLFPIPDHVTYEEATLAEPLSVGLHACRKSGLKAGATVFVTGMGPVGLTAVMAAKAMGAANILVSDVEPFRLEAAARLGATHLIHALEQDTAEAAAEATNREGVDVVFETTGQPAVLDAAIGMLKRGGKLSLIGFPSLEKVPVNLTLMLQKEIDLITTFRYANTYPLAIRLLASGKYDAKSLLTDFYALKDTQEAMERARTNKQRSIKVIVYPNGVPNETPSAI